MKRKNGRKFLPRSPLKSPHPPIRSWPKGVVPREVGPARQDDVPGLEVELLRHDPGEVDVDPGDGLVEHAREDEEGDGREHGHAHQLVVERVPAGERARGRVAKDAPASFPANGGQFQFRPGPLPHGRAG